MVNKAAATVSFDPNHARVLVVGPMGVGKTSLVRALCQGHHLHEAGGTELRPRPTIGCNVDVKHIAEGPTDRFIEFWDIGGHPDAAPARRMFFEDSSVSGVLFVHDLSNPRSLRELRVWVDELEAAGINIVVDKAGGCPTARASADDTSNGLSRGSLEYVQHQDGDFLAEFGNDLEGGACSECVPTLVVGNKADVVEAAIGDRGWANLPTALEGKLHVCVSAQSLDEGPFLRFIDDIFRYHAGGEMSNGGEAAWSPLSNTNTIARYSGIGEDTLASSLVASTNFTSPSGRLCAGFHIPDVDRLADRRSHQRSISPAQSHGISSMEVSSIGGPSERRENVAPDGRMGGMATIVGRTWWMERDPVSAVRRSREKQS